MPAVSPPADAPRKELDTTNPPPARPQRSISVRPKSQELKTAITAEQKKAAAPKVNAINDAIEKATAARIAKSRKISSIVLKPEQIEKDATSDAVNKPVIPAKDAEKPIAEKTVGGKLEAHAAASDVPKTDATPPATAGVTPDTDGLPDEIVRSLKAFGMADAEIAEGLKDDPKSFKRLAQLTHSMRKKEIEEYANIGRAKAGQQVANAPVTTRDNAPAVPAPASRNSAGLAPIDIATLKKDFGVEDDALLTRIVGPVNQVIANLNAADSVRRQHEASLVEQRVNSFFTAPNMKLYEDDYKDAEKKNRVLDLATHIINGATAAGKKMSVEEALTMAHDATAAPKAKAVARQEVIDEVKKRNQAISQRPQGGAGGGGASSKTTAKDKMKSLEEKTKARLAAFRNS